MVATSNTMAVLYIYIYIYIRVTLCAMAVSNELGLIGEI